MPGVSYSGPFGALNADEEQLAKRLESSVLYLAEDVGPRSFLDSAARSKALAWIEHQLLIGGLDSTREVYSPPRTERVQSEGETLVLEEFANLIVNLGGPAEAPLLLVSAHYDTVPGSPGADDDASGIAALLELANRFAQQPLSGNQLRVNLCFFDGEEAGVERMGSGFYARSLSESGEEIAGAISLEMLGTYTEEPASQTFPSQLLAPFYPSEGNFLAFVGNESSGPIVRSTLSAFRAAAQFPSEGLVAPDSMPDVGRSDHASFWAEGWPGLMITDTANFRNQHYHLKTDTADRVDYARLARITRGLEGMIRKLAIEGL